MAGEELSWQLVIFNERPGFPKQYEFPSMVSEDAIPWLRESKKKELSTHTKRVKR